MLPEQPDSGSNGYSRLESVVDEVLSEMRVLFVDDNTLSCRISHRLLSGLGATVQCATSGPEALEIAQSSEFDLIVLDCAMPGMSGFDVAKELRSPGSRAKSTRIVALAFSDDKCVRQRAQAVGMEQVLCKPFSSESMLELLQAR